MWWLVVGCNLVRETVYPIPIPRRAIEEVAPMLSDLGHPQGSFASVRVLSWSSGKPEDHERWVDVAIGYTRAEGRENHVMKVRLYVEREHPCRISSDVLEDNGPEPILLDNSIGSAAVGAVLCDALSTANE